MPQDEPAHIAANVEAVEERVQAAADRAGRARSAILLVGASKTQPLEAIVAAARAGIRAFGENRVQEAAAKLPSAAVLLKEAVVDPPAWHLLGKLQSNKVNRALELFDMIESVDSLKLAQALSQRLARGQAGRSLPVLLEVYVGDDPARPGFRPEQLGREIGVLADLPGLAIQGLMTVAPLGGDLDDARRAFARVRRLRDDLRQQAPALKLAHLSMGMTEDFEAGIEEGATMVRIGRAIFGSRL